MNHKISVILPFHKIDDFFQQAVESCLGSTNIELELILVNTSKASYKSFESQVSVLEAPGKSYLDALRIGLLHAKHPNVGIMNSDDLIVASRFYKQLEKLESEEAQLCLCWIQKIDTKTRKLPSLTGKLEYFTFHPSFLLLGPIGADASWVFKRDWALSNNLFAERTDVSDFATALRVMPRSKICVVPEHLYFYRTHKGQVTSSSKNSKPTHEIELLIKLNSYLGLPTLTIEQHQVLAFCSLREGKLGDSIRLRIWRDRFLSIDTGNSSNMRENLLSLIRRRFLVYSWRQLNNWDSKKEIFPFLHDLIVLGRNIKK
jgi:glycosyltransferase involved in cell wall biosynthesis